MKEQANGTLLYLHSDKRISVESAFLIESLLVIYHRFCCWLIEQAVTVKRVSVEYEEPAHAAEYRVLFTCSMEFKQGITGLLIDSSFLNQKVVKSNVDLTQFFEEAPAGILSRPQNDQSFSAKIRQILMHAQDEVTPTFQEIASSLAVTEQTLRRRLKDEGVTYKELKENIRRDLAVFLLTHNELAIKDVSARLGFAETSAFQRAFKDWTGVTPANYRDNA
jgi:AraC-like DNA-binding protein